MKAFLLLKSDFLKNTLWLTSGTTIAQIISLFTAPVLTRIYSPEDYGMLGIYMVFCTLIGTLASLQYSNAIVMAENDDQAKSLFKLSVFINIGIVVLTTILILFFRSWLSDLYHTPHLRSWVLLAPFSVLFVGLNTILSGWGLRKKRFKLLSRNRIYTALLAPVFSISIGLMMGGPFGLFIGLLLSQILPTIRMGYFFLKEDALSLSATIAELQIVANKFKNFPKFSLPADFINNFSNQIPVLMLSLFGPHIVGWYGLSARMLAMPTTLIASAVSEVFRQRAAQDYNTTGTCRPIFLKVLKTLFLLSVLPFSVLIFFAPELFSFFFGHEWEGAGEITSLLAILYLFKFVVSPLSFVAYIAQKQWVGLMIDCLLLATVGGIYLVGKHFHLDYKTVLLAYAIGYSLLYFITLYINYKFSINEKYVVKD